MIRLTLIFALGLVPLAGCAGLGGPSRAGAPLRLAVFEFDATPPMGAPLCFGLVRPAESVDDPLTARGVVLLPAGQEPMVLCVFDWVGIGNGGYEAWRTVLAEAAGTSPGRVAVHATHAHDAPGFDTDTEALLAAHGLSGAAFDVEFGQQMLDRGAAALEASLAAAQPVTDIGTGKADVQEFASTRRLLGPEGRVKWVRYSASRDPEARAQPEGLIDPAVRLISFWNGDTAIAVLSYYATHPQSHYGKGAVSCDTVGMARNMHQHRTGVPHLHFNGAGGDVAAGKYNDGNPANRELLAGRLADGMARAWQSTRKTAIKRDAVGWRVEAVALPPSPLLDRAVLQGRLEDPKTPVRQRVAAARDLVWLARCERGDEVELSCLSLGPARIVHMPGELFVEYQLGAQEMREDLFVAMAAYGDYGMGYIGTEAAYAQGGYEVQPSISRVAPQTQCVLMRALTHLLDD